MHIDKQTQLESLWLVTDLVIWLTSHVAPRFVSLFFSPCSCYSSSINSSVLSEPFSCRTLGAVSVPAHLPLCKTERHSFTASSPLLVLLSFFPPFSTSLSPRSLSHLPQIAKFMPQPTCCFCSTNVRHSPLQSKLMSKDTKTCARSRNQQTNSDTLIVRTHTHTHIQSLKFYG